MPRDIPEEPGRTVSDDDDLDDEWPRRPAKPLDVALSEFATRRDFRSFRAVVDRRWYEEEMSPGLSRDLEAAIWCAAESSDWRLRAAGIDELHSITGQLARKADTIVAGLQARQKSVRCSAEWAVEGLRLARLVLVRLEKSPPAGLLTFELLMAVDHMAGYLTSPPDHQRLTALVRRLEGQPRIPGLVQWKIGESLHSDLHFGLEPDDESIDADHWREYRRLPRRDEA
jgi:hypothetical protein